VELLGFEPLPPCLQSPEVKPFAYYSLSRIPTYPPQIYS